MDANAAQIEQQLDLRLARLADAVDDLRLQVHAQRVTQEELLTNIDLALRAILAEISQNVLMNYDEMREMKQKNESLRSDITMFQTKQAKLERAINEVKNDLLQTHTRLDNLFAKLDSLVDKAVLQEK